MLHKKTISDSHQFQNQSIVAPGDLADIESADSNDEPQPLQLDDRRSYEMLDE